VVNKSPRASEGMIRMDRQATKHRAINRLDLEATILPILMDRLPRPQGSVKIQTLHLEDMDKIPPQALQAMVKTLPPQALQTHMDREPLRGQGMATRAVTLTAAQTSQKIQPPGRSWRRLEACSATRRWLRRARRRGRMLRRVRIAMVGTRIAAMGVTVEATITTRWFVVAEMLSGRIGK